MNINEKQKVTNKKTGKWKKPTIITIKKEELAKYVLASACSGYGGCATLIR